MGVRAGVAAGQGSAVCLHAQSSGKQRRWQSGTTQATTIAHGAEHTSTASHGNTTGALATIAITRAARCRSRPPARGGRGDNMEAAEASAPEAALRGGVAGDAGMVERRLSNVRGKQTTAASTERGRRCATGRRVGRHRARFEAHRACLQRPSSGSANPEQRSERCARGERGTGEHGAAARGWPCGHMCTANRCHGNYIPPKRANERVVAWPWRGRARHACARSEWPGWRRRAQAAAGPPNATRVYAMPQAACREVPDVVESGAAGTECGALRVAKERPA